MLNYVEVISKHREEVGLCYPQKYEEHYMRIFVKDERKFKAALYAFQQTCKKFSQSGMFTNDEKELAAVMSSPMKERQYSS